MDDALKSLFGNGHHQAKVQILGVCCYFLGSQILNMMPFLQLYPALECPNDDGDFSICKREAACKIHQYEYRINWGEHISLQNWTTELDLICMDPAKMGMMGIITFISIGIGSIILGGLID